MKKTAKMNEIQVVLQEYLGSKKAAKVAETVHTAMHAETQHTHNEKNFFINEDSNGALVLTMESMVRKNVETILIQNLEEDEVQDCLRKLMAAYVSTEIVANIETILIEGSNSHIYSDLLEHPPANSGERKFLKNLRNAIEAGVKRFNVPIFEPSITEKGCLQFVAGHKPAVGFSYNELEKLASKNGVQLGTKNQYVLFSATIINRLLVEGWSRKSAFHAVCTDSRKLKDYYDFTNNLKILAKDEKTGNFWIVGTHHFHYSKPLANMRSVSDYNYDRRYGNCVGWFVIAY